VKFRIEAEIDIDFDLESDGVRVPIEDSGIDSDVVGKIIKDAIQYQVPQDVIDDISDDTGWCVNNIKCAVTNIECAE
jgi:hypothetical protein